MYIITPELGIPDNILIRLTDDEGTGTINTARAESAIAAGQAIIDCTLSKLYAVPFSAVPDLVKNLNAVIAVYFLYQRFGQVPEDVRRSYEDALKFLDGVASGSIVLDGGNAARGPEFSCQDREFSREYMEGF